MSVEISASAMVDALNSVLVAGLTPMIVGSPGIGKSDITKSLAKMHNLKLIDMRLAQSDPTDLNGFPTLQQDGTRMDYAPPMTFPLAELDEVPTGFDGWLLFLDEINAAPPSIQAAAYKLILDRQIGKHDLHKNVAIVCAGNKSTDKAIVNRLSTAMQSRMIHLNLMVDSGSWLEWANTHGIDHRIISFIKYRPELLHKFNPNHADDTFASPRTWEFLSKIIAGKEKFTRTDHAVMVGTVGEGPATEFRAYCSVYKDLPTIEEMLESPKLVNIPKEPGHQYAMTTLISHNANDHTIQPLMIIIKKLPVEFQVVVLKDIYALVPELKENKIIKDWIEENADKLFG
jgi:hypothetical protein